MARVLNIFLGGNTLTAGQWSLVIALQVLLGVLVVFSPLWALAAVVGLGVTLPGAYFSPVLVYALILLAVPSQYTAEGTRGMADIKLIHLATAAGLISWIMQWVRERKITIDIRWLDLPILLFIGWALLSAFWAVDTYRTLFFDIKLINAFVTYFVLIFLVKDKKAFDKVLLIWLLVCLFWSGVGIWTMLFESIPAAQEVEITEGVVEKLGKTVRVSAIFANPNELAFFLSIATVMAIVSYRTRPEKSWKVVAIISVLLASVVLIGTFSRKSWLAIFLSIGILSIKDRRVLAGCAAVGLISFVFLVFSVGSGNFVDAVYNRVLSFLLEPELAMEERAAVWIIGMDLFARAPVVGSGAGSFYALAPSVGSVLPIPHSLYVLFLVEYGLVGLSIFLLFVGVCAVGLVRIWRHSDEERTRYYALGLLATLASVVFQAFFKTLAFTNYNFLCFFALLMSFLRVYGVKDA